MDCERGSGKEKETRGFTLVELSIVLVVVGLLIGGILVGQTLISAAKLNILIANLSQFDGMVNSFNGKFRQLPGDSTRFAPAGNGNGKIDAYDHMYQYLNSATYKEVFYFWKHLSLSGHYGNEQFTDYSGPANFTGDFNGLAPRLNYGDGCFLTANTIPSSQGADKNFGNSWVLSDGMSQGINECMTVVDAMAFDKKTDDGLPSAGAVQQMYRYSGPRVTAFNGCSYHITGLYDINGVWNGATNSAESTPNPGRIECMLAIQAIW